MPPQIPVMVPTITSVGQCTNKYRRLKAMIAARMIAGIPNFLLRVRIAVATVKLTLECPDGNE